jgi:hypothetical protein
MRRLLRRIIDEKRRVALPVLGGLVLNLAVYAGVVYPFSARVRSTESRSQTAAQQLQAAEREDAAARGVVEGRDRTDAALQSFYKDVLPANIAHARRTTFLKLAQLAEKHNLERAQRDHGIDIDKESTLRRMRMSMSLQGDYQDIRHFIYEVESGVDFIVIDSVALREGVEASAPLTIDLVLSTYYRVGTGGA